MHLLQWNMSWKCIEREKDLTNFFWTKTGKDYYKCSSKLSLIKVKFIKTHHTMKIWEHFITMLLRCNSWLTAHALNNKTPVLPIYDKLAIKTKTNWCKRHVNEDVRGQWWQPSWGKSWTQLWIDLWFLH